jgi:hypothetical protein
MMTEDRDPAKTECALIEMAVETWRFARLFGRVVSRLDVGEQARYATQLRYFRRKVEEHMEAAGLKLVNLEGQVFDAGMAVSAINLSDFAPEDVLLVEQMVEPIVMAAHGVRRQGSVVLRKAHV